MYIFDKIRARISSTYPSINLPDNGFTSVSALSATKYVSYYLPKFVVHWHNLKLLLEQ